MSIAPNQALPKRPVVTFFLIISLLAITFVAVLTLAWDSKDWAPQVAAISIAAFSILASLAGVLATRSSSQSFSRGVSVVVIALSVAALVMLLVTFGSLLGTADWIGAAGFAAATLASVAFDRSFR